MGMRLSFRQEQKQRQVQRLTLAQRQQVKEYQLSVHLDLVSTLHDGVRYRPEATCPSCFWVLTPLEIIQGFLSNPNDFTTACPKCKHRFPPKLIWSNEDVRAELSFLCEAQTVTRLEDLKTLNPGEILQQEPAIYHSAIAHYGLLKNAFDAIDIDYRFDEVADVKTKIEPFFGLLPDTVIARLSGLKVGTVRRLRKSAKIPAWTYRSALTDWEEEDLTQSPV